MSLAIRMALLAATAALLHGPALGQSKDVKLFVKEGFHERIEGLKKGIYCAALSCDFDIESFTATETAPRTFALATEAWLKGTIPGLKGSATRTLKLVGFYTRGTCIIKDIKPVSDETSNNNGWGASKIEAVFKHLEIPKNIVLGKTDCEKVDKFIEATS